MINKVISHISPVRVTEILASLELSFEPVIDTQTLFSFILDEILVLKQVCTLTDSQQFEFGVEVVVDSADIERRVSSFELILLLVVLSTWLLLQLWPVFLLIVHGRRPG